MLKRSVSLLAVGMWRQGGHRAPTQLGALLASAALDGTPRPFGRPGCPVAAQGEYADDRQGDIEDEEDEQEEEDEEGSEDEEDGDEDAEDMDEDSEDDVDMEEGSEGTGESREWDSTGGLRQR